MEEKYEIDILYHCLYFEAIRFAGLAQTVLSSCLMSHEGSLQPQQSPVKVNSIRVAAGSQSSVKAGVLSSLSLCLSPMVMCFIYKEEEKVVL